MWMWRSEMRRMIDDQAERIDELEKKLRSREKELEEYRKREKSVVDALANAHAQGDYYIFQAQKQAGMILKQAKSQAKDIVRETKESQNDILRTARTEAEKGEYLSRQFNQTLRRAAEQARIAADQYAEMIKQCGFDAETYEQEKEDNPVRMPLQKRPEGMAEPDSPAQLMQNIYRLQNREFPDLEGGNTSDPVKTVQEVFRNKDEVPDKSRPGFTEPDLTELRRPVLDVETGKTFPEVQIPVSEEEADAPPTVSEVLGGEATEEEITLDAMLDEIIRSAD